MNKFISKHLVQKLDKSAYVHEEKNDEQVEVVDSDATVEEDDESGSDWFFYRFSSLATLLISKV